MKKFIIAALGVALAGFGINANAGGTATANISPSLTIGGSCTINAAGVSGVFTSQPSGAVGTVGMQGGALVVTCPGIGYSIGANWGLHAPNSTTRQMLYNGTGVAYALGISGNSTNIVATPGAGWTDFGLRAYGVTETMTTGSVAVFNGPGSATGESFNVSGAAVVAGTEPVGTYTDTVLVTVGW